MLFYYFLGHRQAQPCSLTSLGAEEDVEDPLADLFRYAGAIILNCDQNFIFALALGADFHLTPIFIQGVNCIGEQVEQAAVNTLRISLDFRKFGVQVEV